eukprot:scaffold11850_cov111-Isochrysis_galbana.AAC.1
MALGSQVESARTAGRRTRRAAGRSAARPSAASMAAVREAQFCSVTVENKKWELGRALYSVPHTHRTFYQITINSSPFSATATRNGGEKIL